MKKSERWIPSVTVRVRKWLITNPDREGGDVKAMAKSRGGVRRRLDMLALFRRDGGLVGLRIDHAGAGVAEAA